MRRPIIRALVAIVASGVAATIVPGAPVDFERDVQPIFARHCLRCHGPAKQESGLRLDDPGAISRGGDSGEPLFSAGNANGSHLFRLVSGADPKLVMPLKGERLSEAETAVLREWIDAGAVLPETARVEGGNGTPASAHWSLQPLQTVQPPAISTPFLRSAVDAFVLERLVREGLRPSPEADRRMLIRRLYLVALGLPPESDEVEAFAADTRPGAYEALVDRVLGSPRYGERWARHWLDVVRYADSNGFETNRLRLTAYHYRDWVIRALNQDKPYNAFVQEQLAGDQLGADAATGFLVAGAYDIVKSPDPGLTLMQRQDELADMVNTTGTAFLGLTVGCARCHNHKFDPIPQKDYYAMQAVFAGVQHGERALRESHPAARQPDLAGAREQLRLREVELDALRARAVLASAQEGASKRRPAVQPGVNVEAFAPVAAVAARFSITRSSSSEPCLDEWEILDEAGRNVASASAGAKPSASGTLQGYPIHKLEHVNDGKFGNNWSWISNAGNGWVRIDFPAVQRIVGMRWSRDREGAFADRVAVDYRIEAFDLEGNWRVVATSEDREPYNGPESSEAFLARLEPGDAARARTLFGEIAERRNKLKALEQGPAGWLGSFAQPGPTHRLYRGDPFQEREEVEPGGLSVLGSLGLPSDAPEAERRLRLGEWITSDARALAARVIVNRIWHYHFGTGIVDTPSDFGINGTPPSHPELLEWLATEFIRSGWSLKHLHRLILTSATFRQDSQPNPAAIQRDADCRLLWRYPPARLSAETIRDSMLQASGSLDLRMGGPGFFLLDVVEENVMHYFPKEETGPAEWRRMVYMTKVRQEQDGIFGSFDCPDGNQVMPKRNRSTTPLQALNLFNSRFVLAQSELLAERLRREHGESAGKQIEGAFALLYNRAPAKAEREECLAMVREHGLEAFCRALFNTSEFLFVF